VGVPSAVAQLTVTGSVVDAESATVKTALVVPALPSATLTSLILIAGTTIGANTAMLIGSEFGGPEIVRGTGEQSNSGRNISPT
jgi:hypothetical protein